MVNSLHSRLKSLRRPVQRRLQPQAPALPRLVLLARAVPLQREGPQGAPVRPRGERALRLHAAADPPGGPPIHELRQQVDDRREARVYVNGGLTAEPALRSARMRSSEDGCANRAPNGTGPRPMRAGWAPDEWDNSKAKRAVRAAEQVAQSDASASAGPRVRTHLRTTARRTMQPRPGGPVQTGPAARSYASGRSVPAHRPTWDAGRPRAGAALAAPARRLGCGGGLRGAPPGGGSAAAPRPRTASTICTAVTGRARCRRRPHTRADAEHHQHHQHRLAVHDGARRAARRPPRRSTTWTRASTRRTRTPWRRRAARTPRCPAVSAGRPEQQRHLVPQQVHGQPSPSAPSADGDQVVRVPEPPHAVGVARPVVLGDERLRCRRPRPG